MFRIFLLIVLLISLSASQSFAFWVWTPETNKWTNPKYSVKDTPSEQLDYAKSFYEAESYEDATKEFEKLLNHYPRAREAPVAQYWIGRINEDLGNNFDAFKEYQVVIEKYPFSDKSAEIVKRQYDIGNALLDGNEEKSKFMSTLKGTNYDIIEVFRTVIKNAPYGDYAPPSQYKIGLYLMENNLYLEARDEFELVLNDYPDSEWAQAAKYQIALADSHRSSDSAYDQRITQAAVEEFEEFLEIYPDAELSEKAKEQVLKLREKEAENTFMIARYYEKQKAFKAAKIYYQTIVDDYKDTLWAKKALNKIQDITVNIE